MNILDAIELVTAILALIIGFGSYVHSRTNRWALMEHLQRRPENARNILRRTGEDIPYIKDKASG